jgi:alanine-glyoxylate transaminase/serine-glyoxylate transaminase/serine-pyruvate transaminase
MVTRPQLMIPGPIDVPDDVLDPMGRPTVAHYGDEWSQFYWDTIGLLQYAFCTTNSILILPGSGTMGIDASVGSMLRSGDRVLVLSNGSYGDRLAAVARGYLLETRVLSSPFFQPIPLAPIEAQLQGGGLQAVLMVHNETSGAVLNPVREVSELCQRYGVPLIVDAVSSLGTTEFETDSWGVDICVSASQKGLEAPPGLALVSISKRAWQLMEQKAPTGHGFGLSLLTWRDAIEEDKNWHPSLVTMPCALIMALHVSLKRFKTEGWPQRLARYRRTRQLVRTGLRALGFDLLVDDRHAATGVTAAVPPAGVDPLALKRYLLDRHNLMVASAEGEWQKKALRIGHMGVGTQPERLITFLLAMEDAVRHFGWQVVPNSSLSGMPEYWGDEVDQASHHV